MSPKSVINSCSYFKVMVSKVFDIWIGKGKKHTENLRRRDVFPTSTSPNKIILNFSS